jgi:aspartate/methionine/tyrosine aminotransferase
MNQIALRKPTDSITAYSRAALQTGAIDLCAGVWPDDATAILAGPGGEMVGIAGYPPPNGRDVLRSAIAAIYDDPRISPAHVTVTPGATGALFTALEAIGQPGEDVLLAEPGYTLFGYPAGALGLRIRGVPARVPPQSGAGWRLDTRRLARAVARRTRGMIICDPDNPTGALVTSAEWDDLVNTADAHGLTVIADRTYESYAPRECLVPSADLVARGVVVVSSASKSLHAAGLRVGWILANPRLADRFGRSVSLLYGGVSSPAQGAVAAALHRLGAAGLLAEAKAAQGLHTELAGILTDQGLSPWPAEGGLFLTVPAARLGTRDAEVAWQRLLARGVGGVPSTAFGRKAGGEAFIRLTFARSPATLSAVREALSQTP